MVTRGARNWTLNLFQETEYKCSKETVRTVINVFILSTNPNLAGN